MSESQPSKGWIVPKPTDVSKKTWRLTSIETIRLIRDGEKGRRREKREIIYNRYTVTTKMTPALRWAAI